MELKAGGACLLGIGSHLKFSKLAQVVDLSAAFKVYATKLVCGLVLYKVVAGACISPEIFVACLMLEVLIKIQSILR